MERAEGHAEADGGWREKSSWGRGRRAEGMDQEMKYLDGAEV